jgi:adenylate cyclase class 1
LKEFSEAQKNAFLLIPCLLHTSSIKCFNSESGFLAPAGIYNFIWSGRVSHLISQYFPHEKIDLSTVQNPAPIEFLSLMGSVGSIAYTDRSDFDFWVCVREDLPKFELECLVQKLNKIETWSLEKLGVEVHFFVTTASSLKENDYGSVTSESCGTALGKLLKEEYYRGSLLVSGKIPLWWGLPIGFDDQDYENASEFLLNDSEDYKDTFIDIGNVHKIPQGEFLGGGLWQLNKSIGSPFKSVLKMALLMEYSDEKSAEVLVATQTKKMVFSNPSAMRYLDPYQNMLDRILSYYEKKGTGDELHLMRQCFFLKIKPKVKRWFESPQRPPSNVDAIMVDYCKKWNWSEKEIAQCEDFEHLALNDAIKLKQRCETYMQKSLHQLENITTSRKIQLNISDQDRTKMINRLYSVYDDSRSSTGVFYPPFKQFIQDKRYTIKLQETERGLKEWRLYKGKYNLKDEESHLEKKSLLNASFYFSDLFVWLSTNALVEETTFLESPLVKKDFFQRNIRNLCNSKKRFFRQVKIPSFDEADFSKSAYPMQWLICMDMVPCELGELSEIDTSNFESSSESGQGSSFTNVLKRISVNKKESRLERKQGELIKIKTFLPKHRSTCDSSELRRYKIRKLRSTDDPINAWKPKFSLIRNAILLEKNSWGEYRAHDFYDEDWLARTICHILTGVFKRKLNLTNALDFFIGNGLYKNSFLEGRMQSLIQNVIDFFSQPFEASEQQARVFYYEKGGWVYSLIQHGDKVNVQSFDCWLKAMMSTSIIFSNTKIEAGFDGWTEQGRFYGVAKSLSEDGKINVFLLDNPDIVYLIVVDEYGCCSANEIARSELNTYLPKYIYGIIRSMQMVRDHDQESKISNLEKSLEVNWITIDDNGNVYTQDITKNSLSMVNKTMRNMSKLNAEMKLSTVRLFMMQFSYQLETTFRDKRTIATLTRILDQVQKFRSHQKNQAYYDIFLTGIHITDMNEQELKQQGNLLPTSVSGWLNLKLAIEFACLKLLGR